MGKTALAKYHHARGSAPPRRPPGRPSRPRRPSRLLSLVAVPLTGRRRTRVIAALLHGIDPAVIARDQHIPRRVIHRIAVEEGLLSQGSGK